MREPREELRDFCEHLTQISPNEARAALKAYFCEILGSMSVEEIREVKAAMLDEAGDGFQRDVFEAALDGYLAAREERN